MTDLSLDLRRGIQIPDIELPSIDIGKTINDLASAARPRIRRPSRRRPIAFGVLAAGIVGWVVLRNDAVRSRLSAAIAEVRRRLGHAMSRFGRPIGTADHQVAFTAAETAPVQESPSADPLSVPTGYPAGLGSNNQDGSAEPVTHGA